MKNFLSICAKTEIEEICIGKFDGMHLAHQHLFRALQAQKGLILSIIPQDCMQMLTPNKQTYTHFSIYFLQLQAVKEMSCVEFVDFLRERLPNLRKIIVGYDFCFGKNRAYSPQDLKPFFEVCIIPEVKIQGFSVHTKEIITLLQKGKIKLANALLNRYYSLHGSVVSGQGRGQLECYATLNLKVANYILPQDGVYASFCKIGEMYYQSACFLGHRLSADQHFAIEVHLIDQILEDTPQEVEIFFVQKIRQNQKFENLATLKIQITQDLKEIKHILQNSPSPPYHQNKSLLE